MTEAMFDKLAMIMRHTDVSQPIVSRLWVVLKYLQYRMVRDGGGKDAFYGDF